MYTKTGRVELLDVPAPAAGPGEVTLDVLAVGICGSELEGVRSPTPVRVPPLVMGHELVGRHPDTGGAVAVNPLIACGACDLCDEGATNLCRRRQLVGIHRPGGYAERVVVPAARCRPLPAGLDVARAVLAEPIANAVHALRIAERHLGRPPRSLGVIGAGMIGVACALAAVVRGTAEVELADLAEDRRILAERTLAVPTAASLGGEYDVVVDAVGAGATRATAVQRLRPGGVSLWIGLHDPDPGFESRELVRHERVVCGSFAYLDTDFDEALKLCAYADPSWVEPVPLDQAPTRFEELMHAPGHAPKTAIFPSAGLSVVS